MNYKTYEITSVFEDTNRKRKRLIDAQSEKQAIEILKKQGYIEPFDVNVIPHEPPTVKQINYAIKLNIEIPENATLKDLSALISRKVDRDGEPDKGLITFANDRGFLFSMYIGKKELYNLIFYELGTKDKIAFYIFSIYRYLSEDRHANLDTSPHKEKFYKFADKVFQYKSFINSLNRLEGQDLRFFGRLIVDNVEIEGTSTNTISYKMSVAYLKEMNLISDNTSSVKRISNKRELNHNREMNKPTNTNHARPQSKPSIWKEFKNAFFSGMKK